MARANGPFSGLPAGKIGNVIYSSRNGIGYIKSIPARVSNPKTPAQTHNRNRFKMVMDLICPVISLVRIGFASRAIGMTAYNAAVSYNMHHATEMLETGAEVLYPKLMFSIGKYPAPGMPEIEKDVEGKLLVKWTCATGKSRDFVSIVIADETLGKTIGYHAVAPCADMQVMLEMPTEMLGHILHAYLMLSGDNLRTTAGGPPAISDSVYAGCVEC